MSGYLRSPWVSCSSALHVARPSQIEREHRQRRAKPQRLPVGEALIEQNVAHGQGENGSSSGFSGWACPLWPTDYDVMHEEGHDRRCQRSKWEVAVSWIEHKGESDHQREEHRHGKNDAGR